MEWWLSLPIPNILIGAGIAFIFVGLGGQLGGIRFPDGVRPQAPLLAGVVLLVVGLISYYSYLHNNQIAKIIPDPRVGNLRVDACLYWGDQCNQAAADAVCRQNNFLKATDGGFDVDFNSDDPLG